MSKSRWKSGSDLLENLFNNVENYKKINKECYKTCNDILCDEAVDLDELYHAKAVLEQKMEARKSYQNMLSNTFSFVAIILSAMAVVISALKGNVDKIDIGCLTILIIVACSMIYYFGDSFPINKYMYYVYSLICTEIEDRKSCNENIMNKNKKGKKEVDVKTNQFYIRQSLKHRQCHQRTASIPNRHHLQMQTSCRTLSEYRCGDCKGKCGRL